MKLVEYPDADLMMMDLADLLVSELNACLMTHDRATFCVPGGTTPGPIFDILSAVHLEWSRVDVVLNDERWVPESHPRSNTALLRQRLITGNASGAQLLPLWAEAESPEAALPALTAGVEGHLPLSVLLLGMGADMHTASLFPGADRLREALDPHAPPLLPMRAEGAGEPRITFTARVLQSALSCHILIKGPEKRAALERAKTLPVEEAPVRAVLPHATVHWAPA